MAALGWIGLTWPTEFGGAGRPPVDRLIIGEELIAAGAPIAAMWFADRQMGPSLIAYGRPDQQQAFLPGMLSGDDTWCIGMSEPNAGSDLASLTTSAIRDGDEFVINGQKIWTSFGAVADYCYVICRTTTDGPPHQGISEVIVPMDTPGVEVRPIKDMTTNQHFCEVFFTDVRVPVTNLVGIEGNAFKQTMRQLEHERGGIDRLVSNHALFTMAVERADRTDPRVRQEIAALETGYRIGRILVTREVLRTGAQGLLGGDQVLLHRTRVACRRVRRPHVRRRGDRVERCRARAAVRARLHDHGRHVEHHAQHPRRTGARPAPRTPLTEARNGGPARSGREQRHGRHRKHHPAICDRATRSWSSTDASMMVVAG